MSVFKLIRRFRKDQKGAALVEFGLILPALLAISALIIDFSIWMFEFHRTNEAARRIARLATLSEPLVDQAVLEADGTELCTVSNTNCTGIDDWLAEGQTIQPSLTSANIQVTYDLADIGGLGSEEGYKVLVTTELVDINHTLIMVPIIPGVPDSVTYSSIRTNSITFWFE